MSARKPSMHYLASSLALVDSLRPHRTPQIARATTLFHLPVPRISVLIDHSNIASKTKLEPVPPRAFCSTSPDRSLVIICITLHRELRVRKRGIVAAATGLAPGWRATKHLVTPGRSSERNQVLFTKYISPSLCLTSCFSSHVSDNQPGFGSLAGWFELPSGSRLIFFSPDLCAR